MRRRIPAVFGADLLIGLRAAGPKAALRRRFPSRPVDWRDALWFERKRFFNQFVFNLQFSSINTILECWAQVSGIKQEINDYENVRFVIRRDTLIEYISQSAKISGFNLFRKINKLSIKIYREFWHLYFFIQIFFYFLKNILKFNIIKNFIISFK